LQVKSGENNFLSFFLKNGRTFMQALAEKTLPEPGNSGAYKAFPDESWEPPTFFMYTKSKLEMLDFTASKDIYSSR
jgi:hypothetical protein